jgi:threonine dehydratase
MMADAAVESFAASRADIAAAYPKIVAHIRRTPVVEIDGGDVGVDGGHITLKLELMQHSGSF